MPRILVVFSSLFGANAALAGDVESVLAARGADVRVRGVRQVLLADHQSASAKDVPLATADDLAWADGFVFTSPSHTGLLSASLKAFVDENHDAAVGGAYLDKTFTGMATGAFTHAGQERVVDELNAIGAAWGCVLVPPSTANAQLNALDGNPYGLSFVLDHGRLGDDDRVRQALSAHLERFVRVTAALAAATAHPGADAAPTAASTASGASARHTIAQSLGTTEG